MKKIVVMVIIAVMLCLTTAAYAVFSDVPGNASYASAVNRLSSLGIISGDENGRFNPNDILTREQFAKIIVVTAGLDSAAKSLKGSTIFPDVTPYGWSSGYINVAVDKGLITGMSDGRFHPSEPVTFAQVCTVVVKALGYTDQDVPGLWPRNYIEKAASLHLTDGITLGNNDGVPHWAIAVIIDRLLDTNIKQSTPTAQSQTFADSTGMTLQNAYTYSKPEIVHNFDSASGKLGDIDLNGLKIVRNTINTNINPAINKIGETIDITQIKENDVVYKVSNAAGDTSYILVIDNKVCGSITGYIPNKLSPQKIQVDGNDYELSSYMNADKLSYNVGSRFEIGDPVTLLLGYDGKVVDAFSPGDEDNSNFAFIINTSTKVDATGITYYAKLLFTDGSVGTYKTTRDMSINKGRLVTFKKQDADTLSLDEVSYRWPSQVTIDKDDRMIGNSYVADNVAIFNIISNDDGADVNVNLLDWRDMPDGALPSNKILHVNMDGPFQDINVMLVDDILEQQYSYGIIKRTSYQALSNKKGSGVDYTITVAGKDYSYSSISAIGDVGSIVKVKMANGGISSVQDTMTPVPASTVVQAVDSKRIKINNTIYWLKNNAMIYFKDVLTGAITQKTTSDIISGIQYRNVYVYLDRPQDQGGKAIAVIITP